MGEQGIRLAIICYCLLIEFVLDSNYIHCEVYTANAPILAADVYPTPQLVWPAKSQHTTSVLGRIDKCN